MGKHAAGMVVQLHDPLVGLCLLGMDLILDSANFHFMGGLKMFVHADAHGGATGERAPFLPSPGYLLPFHLRVTGGQQGFTFATTHYLHVQLDIIRVELTMLYVHV